MASEDKWREILKVYYALKTIYTHNEEIDIGLNTNLQTMNEFKAALDHIMRVKLCDHSDLMPVESLIDKERTPDDLSTEPLPTDAELDEFRYKNLTSVLSHIYRAFFDTCDFSSITYRKMILDDLSIYSSDVIQKALPEYYSVIRPKIDIINGEIAQMRSSKGQNLKTNGKGVDYYCKIIKELAGYVNQVRGVKSSLIQLNDEEKQTTRKAKRSRIALYIAVPLLCMILGVVFTKFFLVL